MKKFLTWTAIVVLVIGGGILTFWPVDTWRLYDANQQPLVMTEAESYCAGVVGFANGFEERDPNVAACIKFQVASGEKDNTVPDVGKAPMWMCDGVRAAGFAGGPWLCLDILEYNQLWMIVTGGLTTSWNDAHPRPTAIDSGNIQDAERAPRENRSTGIQPRINEPPSETEEAE